MIRRVLPHTRAIAALALLSASSIFLAACSGGDTPATSTVTAADTASPTTTASPSPTPFAYEGPPITQSDATVSLPMKSDDSHYRVPVGVFGEQIIIQTTPSKQPAADTEGWTYSLWDPATNTFTPAWSDAPGLQETYMQSDGDWIETGTRFLLGDSRRRFPPQMFVSKAFEALAPGLHDRAARFPAGLDFSPDCRQAVPPETGFLPVLSPGCLAHHLPDGGYQLAKSAAMPPDRLARNLWGGKIDPYLKTRVVDRWPAFA